MSGLAKLAAKSNFLLGVPVIDLLIDLLALFVIFNNGLLGVGFPELFLPALGSSEAFAFGFGNVALLMSCRCFETT